MKISRSMKKCLAYVLALLLCVGVLFTLTGCALPDLDLGDLIGDLDIPGFIPGDLNIPGLTPGEGTTPGEDEPTVPPCTHDFANEGVIVEQDKEYFLVRHCVVCKKDISENANVISVSEQYLYDESKHWNQVACAEQTIFAGIGSKPSSVKHFKGNYDNHDLDRNGVCKDCHYKSQESQGLLFADTPDGDGCVVVGLGDCRDKHINVPKEHNRKPVVGIGENAFKKPATGSSSIVENIVGISIPDTVISISCTAFADCENLNNFIVDMANEIFSSESNCLIDKNAQALIRGCEFSVIPEDGSVVSIEAYAFAGCKTLVSINIPTSVQDIGDKAFFECEALVEVKMPENINIGIDVFRGSIHVEVKIDHALSFVPAAEATCETAGNVAHYKCADCDYLFEDEAGTVRIYNVEIPAAHDFDGGKCSKCGQLLDEVRIIAIDEIPFLGKFALGTMEDAIGLPSTVFVTTADYVRHEVNVNWELSDYKKNLVGEYTIRGHVVPGTLHFDEGITGEVSALIEIVEYMKGTADIVFVLDITGSMSDEINNVKRNIASFATALEERGVSARWAAVTYADFESYHNGRYEESEIIMNGASEWFISASEYATTIGGIQIGFGGDGPEMAIDGMMLATTLTTRKNARTIFILVTDADNKVNNHYGVSSMEEMADILEEKKITTSVIAPTNHYSEYAVLVDQTGGLVANIDDNFGTDLLNGLVPIIENEVLE